MNTPEIWEDAQMDNMVVQMRNFVGSPIPECGIEPEEEDPLPRELSILNSSSRLTFDER